MKVIDKSGNVIMEVNRPHITQARMGTARIKLGENRIRKQYKVVSKEEPLHCRAQPRWGNL